MPDWANEGADPRSARARARATASGAILSFVVMLRWFLLFSRILTDGVLGVVGPRSRPKDQQVALQPCRTRTRIAPSFRYAGSDAQQGLDGAAFVHGLVGVGGLLQRESEVEDLAG